MRVVRVGGGRVFKKSWNNIQFSETFASFSLCSLDPYKKTFLKSTIQLLNYRDWDIPIFHIAQFERGQ